MCFVQTSKEGILRKPQKEQFCQNLNVSTGQEAFEAAVVLELSESSLCLNSAYQNSIFAVCSLRMLLLHKKRKLPEKTKIRSFRLRKVLRSDTIILYMPRPGRQFTERYRLQWIAIFLF